MDKSAAFVVSPLVFVLGLSIAAARPAAAQTADSVGIRAQGMAGAFTAVADDSTATWWNPAGLATGSYFNAIVEYGRPRDADADRDRRGFSVAFPALGLSYYRLPLSQIQAAIGSTGASSGSRQDPGTLDVRSLALSQFGVTVGQSVSSHLVVASTLKVMRAAGETEAGLDVGAMALAGPARFGIVVRHLREPTFGGGDGAITLGRQVRAGVAVTPVPRGGFGGATVAVDADLKAVATAAGDERRIGVGAEIWTPRRSVGARGGISASTIGDRRAAPSGGLSLAVRSGVYVDGQVTGGSDALRRGWGVALRLTY